jgi:hypothetical protein
MVTKSADGIPAYERYKEDIAILYLTALNDKKINNLGL